MAKEFAKRLYNSAAWKKSRELKMQSVFYLCERCGHPAYIVHHKIPLTPDNINDQSITLSQDNLQALCLECHNTVHGNSEKEEEARHPIFNSEGQLIGLED